jgi:aldose sugar dehydrogenase
MYFSVGDFHWDGVYNRDGNSDPKLISQDPDYEYGKIFRINPDDGSHETVSIGNRNAQGLLVRKDGSLWETEHGPKGGDELNIIKPGRNYGWPLATYGTRYDGLPWTSARQYGRHDGFEQPLYAWVPSMGISDLIEVDNLDSSWDGDLLVAFLGGQALYRLRIIEGRVVFAEPISVNERVRDILQLPDGTIALWTDSYKLMFLKKAAKDSTMKNVSARIDKLALPPAGRAALETALTGCTECHSLQARINVSAPSLTGVVGRTIASTPFTGYSPALKGVSGNWNRQRLREFLLHPQQFAPGTIMPQQPLTAETAEHVITLLEDLNKPDFYYYQ